MSKQETFFFYLIMVFLSTLFMAISQHIRGGKIIKFRLSWFILSFAPLWIISAFTNSGADYEQYLFICRDAKDRISDSFVEFGWNALSWGVTSLFGSPERALLVIKTLTLSIYFYVLYKLRHSLPLWICLLAFELLLFFNFFLMSHFLAASFLLLSVITLINQKYKSFVVNLILAISIHSSAVFWIPSFILIFIASSNHLNLKTIAIFLFVCILLVVNLFDRLLSSIITNPLFLQYAEYDFDGSKSFGMGSLLLYIVYFYLIYDLVKGEKEFKKYAIVILVLTSFAFTLLGFKISIISRMRYYAIFISMYIIPLSIYRNNIAFTKRHLLWLVFLLLFGGMTCISVINADDSSISQWNFHFPW